MIYCCGGYHKPFKVFSLLPNFQYRDRTLEILVCPVCNKLSAVLTQFNIKLQKYETFRPPRKKTVKFISDIKSDKWQEVKVKTAYRDSSGFVYGLNKELKDGKIYQYAVNFNGEKKLVKIIDNNGVSYA